MHLPPVKSGPGQAPPEWKPDANYPLTKQRLMLLASRNFNRTYVRLKLRPGNLRFMFRNGQTNRR